MAKLRLADERAKIERLRQTVAQVAAGDTTMGALVILYRQRIEDRVDIRPDTRRRLNEEFNAVLKTWPGFERPPRQLTRQSILDWRNRLSREATGHRPPGSKGREPKNNGSSPSLINKCIDALRRMLDILAVSKDKKELLVVELKKGRASDCVVGQIQRYMGYAIDELATPGQQVRGAIIALEDDQRIRRALRVTQNIEFFRYEVSFRLFKT